MMETADPNWFGSALPSGFALLLGLLGAFLLYLGLRQRKKAAAAKSWPTAEGQIIESKIDRSVSTDSDGDRSETYSPRLRYTYQVLGSPYTGNKITIGFQQSFSSRSSAQKAIDAYPEGAHVKVYYDPDKPTDTALELRAPGGTIVLVVGVIFLVLGFIGLLVSFAL